MKELPDSCVRGWGRLSRHGITVPNAIATVCPHCAQRVVFSLVSHTYDARRRTASSSGTCPSCREIADFWCTELQLDFEDKAHTVGPVYIQPAPEDAHDLEGFDVELPPPLLRAYRSAVSAFNAGNHVAAAVCCQRAIEGALHGVLPDERTDLTLQSASEAVLAGFDAGSPLQSIASALRDDGPLMRLFAMEREPDAASSRSAIALLERLVELLYVLPIEIDRHLAALDADTSGTRSDAILPDERTGGAVQRRAA